MGSYLFTNVRILDGSGAPAYPGEALVQGNRITHVGPSGMGARMMPTSGATVIDGAGATRRAGFHLPGLCGFPEYLRGAPLTDYRAQCHNEDAQGGS